MRQQHLIIRVLFIFLLALSSSCSSSEYKLKTLPNKKMTWRFCSSIDNDLNKKGFCYIAKECRRKIIIEKCKPKTLFCPWGDIDCLEKWEILDKKIQ